MSLLLLFHPGVSGGPPPPTPTPTPVPTTTEGGGPIGRNPWREDKKRRREEAQNQLEDLKMLGEAAISQIVADHMKRNRGQ